MTAQQQTVDQLVDISHNQAGQLDPSRIADIIQYIGQSSYPGRFQLYIRYARAIRQRLAEQVALVQTPVELDQRQHDDISQRILATNPEAKRVDVAVKPELLGGLTVQIGDMWYDLSIKGKLQAIEEQLS